MADPKPNPVEIWYGPPWAGRREKLRETILQAAADTGPGAVVALVPTRRRVEDLTRQLLRQSPTATLAVSVSTFEQWVDDLGNRRGSRPPQIDAAARHVLIAELLAGELDGKLTDRRFPGLVRLLAELVSRLKLNGIQTADQLRKRIARYLGHKRLTARQADLVDLFDRYQDALAQRGLADPDDRWHSVLAPPVALGDLVPDGRLLLVTGFYDFTPVQQDLLEHAAGHFKRTILSLDIDLPSWPEPEHLPPPYAVMRPTLQMAARMGAEARRVAPRPKDTARYRRQAVPLAFGPLQPTAPDGLPGLDAELQLIDAADRRDEVERIASAVRDLVEQHPDVPLEQVAVVFGRLDGYGPLVRELFPRYGIPYHLAWSEPVAHTAVAATVFRLLETVAGRFVREDLIDLLSSPLAVLPADGDPELSALQLDRLARQAGVAGGSTADWTEKLQRHATELRVGAERLTESPEEDGSARADALNRLAARAEQYAALLQKLFTKLTPPSRTMSAETFQEWLLDACRYLRIPERVASRASGPAEGARRDVRAWREVVTALAQWVFAQQQAGSPGDRRPLADHVDVFRTVLAEAAIPPDRFEAGVQVLGMLDARGLSFRYALVGGLIEGEWPRRRTRDVFFPPHPKRGPLLYLPDPVQEDRLLLAQALVLGKERVWVSRPRGDAGNEWPVHAGFQRLRALGAGVTEPSEAIWSPHGFQEALGRRLQQADDPQADDWLWLAEGQHQNQLVHGLHVNRLRGAPDRLGPYDGHLGPWVDSDAFAPGGGHVYSTSQLDRYAACPFRFFAQRLLSLEELPEVEEDLTALTRGSLIHDILCRFYQERIDRGERPVRVTEADLPAAAARLAEIANGVLDRQPLEGQFWQNVRDRLVAELDTIAEESSSSRPGLLRDFLQQELDAAEGGFDPVHLETIFGRARFPGETGTVLSEEPVPVETPTGTVCLDGKIDRCDVDQGGTRFIIHDYKTGGGPSTTDIRHGHSFQLPIYLLALRRLWAREGKPVAAAGGYYYVKPGNVGPGWVLTSKDHRQAIGQRAGQLPWATQEELERFLDVDVVERLGRLATAIAGGFFHATLLGAAAAGCRHCPYRTVCRVDYARMESVSRELKVTPEVYVPEM